MPLSTVVPAQYENLLQAKVKQVKALLAPYSPPEPEVFPSPSTGFRLRAEFRMWHDGDELSYVMFRKGEPQSPVAITHFPIAHTSIQTLMPVLRDELKKSEVLRRKLFQVEFLATLSGQMLVSLIYHRKLEQDWEEAADALIERLQTVAPGLSIIGRARKQKTVRGQDYVLEILSVQGRDFSYRQYEQAFTQPNGEINTCMIEWACTQSRALSGDLLELYCGNGNFTLPLSHHFENVIATELSKTSVRAARTNVAQNKLVNVSIVRLSAEEVSQAMSGERVFRRLAELPKPLEQYNLHNVFVDPPRAGLDDRTLDTVASFANILYISCSPVTLAENLQRLCQTHRIERFALFDQFPYTEHMECGVLLARLPRGTAQ